MSLVLKAELNRRFPCIWSNCKHENSVQSTNLNLPVMLSINTFQSCPFPSGSMWRNVAFAATFLKPTYPSPQRQTVKDSHKLSNGSRIIIPSYSSWEDRNSPKSTAVGNHAELVRKQLSGRQWWQFIIHVRTSYCIFNAYLSNSNGWFSGRGKCCMPLCLSILGCKQPFSLTPSLLTFPKTLHQTLAGISGSKLNLVVTGKSDAL